MNPVVHFEIPYKVAIRAKEFYRNVFGWQLESLGPEMGDYILATTAMEDVRPNYPKGAINGGLYPYKPGWPDQYPAIVIGVEDIQQSIRKIKDCGGEVLGEPHEIPQTGL